MTIATTPTRIEVYWDAQDPRNEGWAYRVYRGERENSGAIEDYAGCDLADGETSLQDAVVAIAYSEGLEIEAGDVAYEPHDGGYAVWSA